jgi:hypothetical protein
MSNPEDNEKLYALLMKERYGDEWQKSQNVMDKDDN